MHSYINQYTFMYIHQWRVQKFPGVGAPKISKPRKSMIIRLLILKYGYTHITCLNCLMDVFFSFQILGGGWGGGKATAPPLEHTVTHLFMHPNTQHTQHTLYIRNTTYITTHMNSIHCLYEVFPLPWTSCNTIT